MNDPLIGRTFGEFIIKEKLSEGGFGTVYRAAQPILDREAVVKVIHEKHIHDRHYMERFLREARLASQLEHPYTASIYAFGVESDGLLWISMEFVRGTPLNKLLKAQGPLPLERFVPLLEKICEVVQTAHESGIIHRDLKPANVMVISRAGRLLPKLLDFGIAKSLGLKNERANEKSGKEALTNDDLTPTMTFQENPSKNNGSNSEETDNLAEKNEPIFSLKESAAVGYGSRHSLSLQESMNKLNREVLSDNFWTMGLAGSPPYMAPEQWKESSSANVRTDIYALGVLSYESLTGSKPFQGDIDTLRQMHESSEMPSLGPSFPAALDQAIAKATAKRSEDRFSSAIEFAGALRKAAGMVEEHPVLISLEETLCENLIAGAPQPIAEATANLAAAHNLYQAREQILELIRAAVRYLGATALACRAQSGRGGKGDSEMAVELLHILRRHGLNEEQWLELTRELCRPFALQRDAYPIPEMVSFFFEQDSEKLCPQARLFEPIMEFCRTGIGAGDADRLFALLNKLMPQLAALLRALSFLSDYQLVVPYEGYAERWMGNRLRGIFPYLKGEPPTPLRPLLANAEGNVILSLWPFALVDEPTPNARKEIFFLKGNSHNGAKWVSFPLGFEHTDESFWPWFETNVFEISDRSGAEVPIEQTPYLGLSAFESKNESIFFGREKETENFLNRLRIQPLILLAGRSGAGKSSFIQAGVAPRLAENCRIITLRPGAAPLASLSSRLIKEGIRESDMCAELASDPLVLGAALRDAAARSNSQIVLIIDQLEEIFTLCLDQSERERYAGSLAMAARTVEDPVRIIFTLRDDFLVRARELPGLGEKLIQGLELLPTPGLENLVRILVEPARRAGYEFEDQHLPMEMAKAVVGRQGALPLLAFSAAKLWEMRDRQFRQLRRKDYETLGGVGGALAGHAEEMIKQMPQQELRFVREAFRRLVTSEGTRAVLSRAELEQVLGNNSDAQIVLEKLIAARLLSVFEGEGGIECIEVVHEALLTAWPRLVQWRQQDVEGSRLRDQLHEAARQWEERGKPSGLLWRNEALTELQLWRSRYSGKLTECEVEFCNSSINEAAQWRRRKRLLLSAAIAFLLFALTAAFWINREIQNQLLESYQEQGRQELLDGRAIRASLYFNEVYKQGKDSPALRLLLAQSMRSVDAAQISTLEGHKESVNHAAFSPDGKRAVTASDDQTARVWDAATGMLLLSLVGHTDEALGAAFSHDGARIVTASRDHTAKIWDAKTGQLLNTLEGHSGLVRSAQFSPDDRHIVTASEDQTAIVWDSASGRMLIAIQDNAILFFAAFSPNGARIVTASSDHNAKVWDAVSGKNLFTIEGHTELIRSAVFSPDGTKIVTASGDKTAKIWNAANGKLSASLEGHKASLTFASFSPDGALIATSSGDKTIKLWNAATGKMLTSLEVHTSYVWSVNFNNDATQVITSSYDGTAKVWNAANIKVTESDIEGYKDGASDAQYSPDGARILTAGGGNMVRILDASSKKELLSFTIHSKGFRNITAKFSPDGKRIVTSVNFDLVTRSKSIGGNSLDKTAKVWDAATGELLLTLTGHEADLTYAAFSPDNKRIVTASLDNTAKVWDAATGKELLTLAGHNGLVSAAEFSSDGSRIVTASHDQSAKIWNAADGKKLRTLEGHTQALVHVSFSPDGRRIVTTSTEATAKVWDAATGRILFSLDGHSGDVRHCAYSSDGKLIATASADSSAKIWDGDTGKMLVSLEGHTDWVNTVKFNPDQTQLLTSSNDGAIKIWKLLRETRTPDEIGKIIEQRVPYRFDRGQLIPTFRKRFAVEK